MKELLRRDAEHQKRILEREEAKVRRQEERLLRKEQMCEDRERWEEERVRRDIMMQMLMGAVMGQRATDIMTVTEDNGA